MKGEIAKVLKHSVAESMKCDEFWRELQARHVRSLSEVEVDGIVERQLGNPYGVLDPRQNQRSLATAHVLCTIPDRDYRSLVGMAKSLLWFIPDFREFGSIHALVAGDIRRREPRTKLIWLSPLLDRTEWDAAVAVIAHEMAHLVVPVELSIDDQEDGIWGRVANWGFESEMRVLFAMDDLEKREIT